MQALDLNNITLTGELAFRLGRNYSRLEDPMYRAAEIFQADKQGWPGDWEGRTILVPARANLRTKSSVFGRNSGSAGYAVERTRIFKRHLCTGRHQ